MKKTVLMSVAVLSMTAMLVTGCVTSGPSLSDEELVQLKVEQWSQGLIENDLDKFLATISESFSSRQADDKAELGGFIEEAIEAGYLEEAEVFLEDAQFTIEEGVCSVYPIDLMSSAGSVAIELTFIQEKGDWFVADMGIDGL
ncbi:MAG: hypothetical protein KAH38_11080 [Candidatus Hydrogenedentes bacterium]|nr:hypothetical protein [Candidatus Hydrogenedentota bacterium]